MTTTTPSVKDSAPRKPRVRKTPQTAPAVSETVPTTKPRTRSKTVAEKTVSINLLTEETLPIARRLKEIADICDIKPAKGTELLSDPEIVVTLLNKLVSLTEGEKIIYVCETEPVSTFVKTRRKAEKDKEKESPYDFLHRYFAAENNKPIMLTDKAMIDKAIEVARMQNPRYDRDKFIREAIRKAAQTEISTWAAKEIRLDKMKDEVRVRSGPATEQKIRNVIDVFRVARTNKDNWIAETNGGNVPIITHSLIGKVAKVGINTLEGFLAAVRDSDEEDKFEDVYKSYAQYRESGANPEHAVGYK